MRIWVATGVIFLVTGLVALSSPYRTVWASPLPDETAAAGSAFPRAIAPSDLLGVINAVRSGHALRPLRLSRPLSIAARFHSLEMGKDGYFAHDSANGRPFWKRIQRFYPVGNFETWTVGENLAWDHAPPSAATIIGLWMASPEHRANLLAARWREVGIGSAKVPNAPGFYKGVTVSIVTVDFGRRAG
jgi:uncharacterized protein YkwD